MTYPQVISEQETINHALAGKSLARFGDGEIRIALGAQSISQRADPKLAAELRDILQFKCGPHVLPCIPNLVSACPRERFWAPYAKPAVTGLYTQAGAYGSSFVSRPENAPWIDDPQYWASVRRLWRARNVAYVSGDDTLLKSVKREAASVKVFEPPRRDAYSEIDRLERELLKRPFDAVIIALGAAGTALAARLGRGKAQHALDLGHIGMFMENPGAYAITADELTSPEYRALLRHQHAVTHWGKGGHHWAERLAALVKETGAGEVLDYGCGSGTLKPALKALGIKCLEYDPGISGKDMPPKLADILMSGDVLEHVEPDKVAGVLRHQFLLTRKAALLAIAKQPAKAILKDGRNAHLSCHPDDWWLARLREAGWRNLTVVETAWKKVLILARK